MDWDIIFNDPFILVLYVVVVLCGLFSLAVVIAGLFK